MTKCRLIVLTDISGGIENDDIESMCRLLLYSDVIDIEGLIAVTSCWKKRTSDWSGKRYIMKIINAYEKIKSNLDIHSEGFPPADRLRSITCTGIRVFGKNIGNGFGEEKYSNNAGVKRIIDAADADDDRPLWIALWGGANTLAQAVWQIKQKRSAGGFDAFLKKLRIYAISDQDAGGHWLRENFGDRLFYIVSPSPASGSKYYCRATWPGISADHFEHGSEDGTANGGFDGADSELVGKQWICRNICRGIYGAQYPVYRFIMEGDTPSFLGLIPNGLNAPDNPNYGGWGGRYEKYIPSPEYTGTVEKHPVRTNASDSVIGADGKLHTSPQATIWRWREDFQNDFAARIAWTLTDSYAKANHAPVVRLAHKNILHVKSGEKVTLCAEGSFDPGGNNLTYTWYRYMEAGTYNGSISISNRNTCTASFTAPQVSKTENIHIILEICNDGVPKLKGYQRVIVTVEP